MAMKCGQRLLTVISLGFGLMATGILSLAVVTDYWLFTNEPFIPRFDEPPINNSSSDGGQYDSDLDTDILSANLSMSDSIGFESIEEMVLIINVHSGLWRMCMTYDGIPPHCSMISYQEWERISEADTTWSILRAIRKSSPVIVFSLLLMIVAFALSTIGNSKRDSKTVSGAVVYVFAALSLAVGVILYISAVNDEVAHRKAPSTDGNDFEYHYGWAFFFAGAAFICSMLASVTNITLYLNRYPTIEDKASIIPGLDKKTIFEYPRLSSEDEMESVVCSQNPTIIL